MRKITFFTGLILALALFVSCEHDSVRASDEISSLTYGIPNYSAVKVSSAFNAYVTFSATEESIRIEANDNLHEKIVVKKDGNDLIIKLEEFTNVRGNATLNAYITTNNVERFYMSGASKLVLENQWVATDARIKLSGASSLTGEVDFERLDLDMSGASSIDIFGNAVAVDARLTGSSDFRDYDLSVERLKLSMSGASDTFVSVSESIDIDARGASVLNYKGNATIIREKLSGASEIKNKD